MTLPLDADGDAAIARWAAQKQSAVFERAFGRAIDVVA